MCACIVCVLFVVFFCSVVFLLLSCCTFVDVVVVGGVNSVLCVLMLCDCLLVLCLCVCALVCDLFCMFLLFAMLCYCVSVVRVRLWLFEMFVVVRFCFVFVCDLLLC